VSGQLHEHSITKLKPSQKRIHIFLAEVTQSLSVVYYHVNGIFPKGHSKLMQINYRSGDSFNKELSQH